MRIKCIAINVEKNAYRKDRILRQAHEKKIDLSIFRAVTPKTVNSVASCYTPERTRLHWGRELMPTELACGLSHLSLWRGLLSDDNFDAYLIFEDDVTIEGDLSHILSSIDWEGIDLLKLSGQHKRPQKIFRHIDDIYSIYRMAYGPLDASAYVLNKKAASKLLNYCNTMHMAVDVLLDRSYEYGLKMHTVQPYPVVSWQCDDPSNPLFTDIGVRDNKYDELTTSWDKVRYRALRFRSSILKRISEIRVLLS